MRATVTGAGRRGWRVKSRSGDDYTRMQQTWGSRSLTLDRDANSYREVISLYDGTVIESSAALTDHRDS